MHLCWYSSILIYISRRSSWSHHGQILEIGDIIEQEALEFLHSQGVEVGAAKIAFDLVGGRIVDLKLIVDTFHHDMNFDGIPLLPKNDHLLTKFTEITQVLKSCQAPDITTKGLK